MERGGGDDEVSKVRAVPMTHTDGYLRTDIGAMLPTELLGKHSGYTSRKEDIYRHIASLAAGSSASPNEGEEDRYPPQHPTGFLNAGSANFPHYRSGPCLNPLY